jgi:hypothetical protein
MNNRRKKRNNISEKTLVDRTLRKLKNLPSIQVCREVPILGRSVDLAYVRDGILITVEFKVHDWRRALLQVRAHLLAADYCYICMPERRISNDMESALEHNGVGLLFYTEEGNWPFVPVIEAKRSEEIWETARSWVLEYIGQNKGRASWQKEKR